MNKIFLYYGYNKNIFFFFFTFLSVFFIGITYAFFDPFPHHEGSILYPAYMINKGYLPLKDVTLQHFPTVAYLYAFFFKVFGNYLIVSRFVNLFCISLLSGIVFLVLINFIPKIFSYLFCVFYSINSLLIWDLVTRPWPTSWALLFLALTTYLIINFFIYDNKRYFIFASITSAFILIFRINLGFYSIIGVSFLFVYIHFINDNINLKGVISFIRKYYVFYLVYFIIVSIFVLLIIKIIGTKPLIDLFRFQKSLLDTEEKLTNGFYNLYSNLGLSRVGLFRGLLFFVVFHISTYLVLNQKNIINTFLITILFLFPIYFIFVRLERGYALDIGLYVIFFAFVELIIKNSYFKIKEKNSYLTLLVCSLISWGVMYPGHDTRYLAWAGLFLFSTIFVRLYIIWKNINNEFPFQKLFIGFYFIFIFLVLIDPRIAIRNIKILLKPRIEIDNEGFYKYMKADTAYTTTYLDYKYLKQYINSTSNINNKILILDGESMHAAYLNRVPINLPYISLDNLVYNLPNGMEIENDIINKIKNEPDILVIRLNRIWEVPENWFGETAFTNLKKFIDKNYFVSWTSPNGNYVVLSYQNK